MKSAHLLPEECKQEIRDRLTAWTAYVNETASGVFFDKGFYMERVEELKWVLEEEKQ